MTTQLKLYNQALLHLKASTLASVTEERESRRVLDALYADVLSYMLELGFWKFAIRSVEVTNDTANVPAFGLSMAFNKPTDWVQTYMVSGSPMFEPPLWDWIEESNLWFASSSPIYVRYVSNDAAYGGDLARFTNRFALAATFELAWRAFKLAGSGADKQQLEKDRGLALSAALSFEALREPPRRPPQGRWTTGRFGRGSPRRVSGGWLF